VTIWAPGEYHFVRRLTYDVAHQRMRTDWLSVNRTYAIPRRAFPSVPVDALRWVAQNGGFDQPISTVETSNIVGVRVLLSNGKTIQTRFASAWSYEEPDQLKRLQSWYSNATYEADYFDRNNWRVALSQAIYKRRVRQIRFSHNFYTLVINTNGTARIAVRRGRRAIYARGRFDRRALVPLYNAALQLRPHAPTLTQHGSTTSVTIVTPGRSFVASGSVDEGLAIFSARMDQLAHDIRWNRPIDV
jgi:hypothetical protein